MAAQLPAKLRTGEIQRVAVRGAQLEKYRPIVTYWCEYYILQSILNRGLHTTDEECANYAVQLMDKLEKAKSENVNNDAIVDDVAAKAYIENFASDTFGRGDEAQTANKVTRQTADTFIAAATFLDLLTIWGPLDAEVAAKSKFAKFHAARILKALKTGLDPNASNPAIDEASAPAEEGIDAELRDMENGQNGHESGVYRPPTVESADHSGIPSRPGSTLQGGPAAPPPLQSQSLNSMQQSEQEISPIESPFQSANTRQSSIGGGYFPSAPEDVNMIEPTEPLASPQESLDPTMNPQDLYNTVATPPTAPPTAPSPRALGIGTPNRPHRPPPEQWNPQAQPQMPFPAPTPTPQAPMYPNAATQPVDIYRTDDEATMAAQKHARWAISALNFEDVNTAVKELRLALASLGAT